jgi:hypothetical protein
VKFTRDFVDSCHPLCLVPPTPTPRFKREQVGVFFWSSVPPLRALSTATPSLAPKRELEGVSSCLPCPLQRLPLPRPASTPPACMPCQCPRPAHCVNAPSLRAASTPLACAPRQCPWPARRVNAPGLRYVDAPGLRAASTPPPLPLRCAPASALTPPLGVLCQCPLLCKRRVCFPLPSFSLR